MSEHDALWLAQRPRLLAIAYNILGSWADAEDTVSEAWVRLQDQGPLIDAPAWLTVVTSRIALDTATSAAKSRTDYIGPWLPEILVVDERSPESQVLLRESVDLALVRMFQELGPVDRVALVLADVFEIPFVEIARVVGSTPTATRKRASRARKSLGAVGPEVLAQPRLEELAVALNEGNLAELTSLLSEGCVLWTDSAGLARAARRPVLGADKVARFLLGIIEKNGLPEFTVEPAVGGAILRAASADMDRRVVLEVEEGRVSGIQIQQNPAKIRRR